jgi:hypothetical protein
MPSGMGWEKKNRKNNMITLSGKPKKKAKLRSCIAAKSARA